MTNKQTRQENVNVGGDADINISQEIHHEPNKLADNIGVVAQAGSAVNISTFNYNQIIQEAKRAGSLSNLPQTNVTLFAGRDEDLVKIHELLQKNQRVAIAAFVKGMGGVGKSELALQYALRNLLTDYSGGICWLRGNEGTLPTQLQDFVQVQLGETMPDGLDSGEKLAGHCWRRLSERVEGRMLVVLDDVKDYENVKPFLPPLDGKFRVLATTRLGLGTAMQQYTLDVLVLAAAVDLLKSFLPEADPRRGNDAEIEKLCEWLGRLPLAIELVGRYLARKPDLSIVKMQERLNAKKLQQDALTDTQRRALAEMTAKLNVAAAFDLSWQELSEGAQKLACLLSLFALAPIHWQWVMDAMGDVDEEDLETCRDDELLNLHLLERKQQGVYELHQLLREYFQFQLQQHPEWQALRQQVAVSLLNISKGIEQAITLDRIKEVSPAIPHLEMLGREMLDDIPHPEESENLLWVFSGTASFYEAKGLYELALVLYQNCLKELQCRLGTEHISVAVILNNIGELYLSLGKHRDIESFYVRALTILEKQIGTENTFAAQIFANLAKSYKVQGKYEKAESLYMRSLEIRERHLGVEHSLIADSLNNLVELHREKGNYGEAERLLIQANEIDEQQQLRTDQAADAIKLQILASLYYSQGKYSEAEPIYLRSLEIDKQIYGEDHPIIATDINNLAVLYYSQGKYSKAESLCLQSLDIRKRKLGESNYYVATNLNNLAEIYKSQQKYNEAETCFIQSIEIHKLQDNYEIANSLLNLGILYCHTHRYTEAIQLFQISADIYEQYLGAEHPNTKLALNWFLSISDALNTKLRNP
jgi:tetratricopeptide (TPR) repeat protein